MLELLPQGLTFKIMKVTLLMAMTLDGKIAEDSDHFPDWTSPGDKKLFADKTKDAGVFIIGSKTFKTIGRALPERKNIVLTRTPGAWGEYKDPNLLFTDQSPEALLADLEAEGFEEVIVAGGTQINTLFAKQGLIDELIVTVSPIIFGKGLGLFSEEVSLSLELVDSTRPAEQLLCLHYKVVNKG